MKDEDIHEYAKALIPVRELSLKGSHNLENMLFLIGTAKILGIPDEKNG